MKPEPNTFADLTPTQRIADENEDAEFTRRYKGGLIKNDSLKT